MRKSRLINDEQRVCRVLQCGRIYKDAEILRRHTRKGGKSHLQCGRIYKDAEILNPLALMLCASASLQCGRIYKDAEIRS